MQDKFSWASEGYYRHEAREGDPENRTVWEELNDQAQADYLFLHNQRQQTKWAGVVKAWQNRRSNKTKTNSYTTSVSINSISNNNREKK